MASYDTFWSEKTYRSSKWYDINDIHLRPGSAIPLHLPSPWVVSHFKLWTWYYCEAMWQLMCRLVAWGRTCGQCERRLPQLPERHPTIDMVAINNALAHVKTYRIYMCGHETSFKIHLECFCNLSGPLKTTQATQSHGFCLQGPWLLFWSLDNYPCQYCWWIHKIRLNHPWCMKAFNYCNKVVNT